MNAMTQSNDPSVKGSRAASARHASIDGSVFLAAVSIVADTVQFLDSPGERPGAWAGDDPDAGELVGVGPGDGAEESGF